MNAVVLQSFQALKLGKAAFALVIGVVNAGYVLADSYLSILYPGNPLVAPTMLFLDAVSNAAVVYLSVKEQAATGP